MSDYFFKFPALSLSLDALTLTNLSGSVGICHDLSRSGRKQYEQTGSDARIFLEQVDPPGHFNICQSPSGPP